MATREIIALNEATPQLLAPQAGDTYLAPRPVGISVGTLTTDQKPLDISATFNNAAVTFTGLKLNVTDTASASGSKLLDVQKGSVSQLVLDKSGNLGLVVEPSAWGHTAAQVKTGSLWSTGGSNSYVGANYYHDGSSRRYISSAAATEYAQTAGQHIWKTAASGTAGNAVTFTNALTLDASGNLGLGVTPSAWTIPAFQSSLGVFAGNTEFNTSTNAYYDGAWKYIGTGVASRYSHAGASHSWYTAISGTAGNTVTWSERFSASAFSFVINDPGNDYDFRIEGDTDANLFFVDASTDRVGIGTNAPVDKFTVVTANQYSIGGWFQTSSSQTAVGDHPVLVLNNTDTTTNNGAALRFVGRDTSATNRAIGQFGGVFTSRTASSVTGSLYVAVVGASGFQESVRFDNAYNLLLGGTTSPTSGTKSLSIFTGTAPTATAADSITVYSSDVSAGNTTLSIYTEGTPVSDSTDNAVTKKIAVRINGTLYYLLADTDNS